MNLWIDAQLSPSLAPWINECIDGVEAISLKMLGLRDAADLEVFMAARESRAVVVTKDADFVELLHQHGPPPMVIWLTCGNTSNSVLKAILQGRLESAIRLLSNQTPLVEIR